MDTSTRKEETNGEEEVTVLSYVIHKALRRHTLFILLDKSSSTPKG